MYMYFTCKCNTTWKSHTRVARLRSGVRPSNKKTGRMPLCRSFNTRLNNITSWRERTGSTGPGRPRLPECEEETWFPTPSAAWWSQMLASLKWKIRRNFIRVFVFIRKQYRNIEFELPIARILPWSDVRSICVEVGFKRAHNPVTPIINANWRWRLNNYK